MSVFIDTSAFLAISNSEDNQHLPAVQAWLKLLEDREFLVTSNYVVVETTALLQKRHGIPAVRTFVEDLLPVVLVEWVDTSLHTSAMSTVLASSSNKAPSLVDCVSFEIIRRSKVNGVFAYDHHFEDRGFNLVG